MSGLEQQENKQGKAVRERTFKVRLSETEYQLLDANNPYGSIAKLLRQAAIEKATKIHNSKAEDDQKIKATKVVESSYSKTDRILILELGRIGNNINQIAKAINTDIASTGAFDKLKLLHLLISIDQQLRELRPDDR
ncbi:plasmid mobilization relaxosome protein MobC [Acinetobacter baumannii]|jgi:lactate dehydrogenase-like 2-hydroxyacid dehydrogenase|uniref:Plasmid mobilization relaxosome protein MobC n=1 Tax=Acinetobacter ursingii TaxID=108980 RepID=A0A2N6V6Q8_9GAMM|nr:MULTISPECIES: MobC family plasmid mobilization relaxosome protein [Acinetobacter]MDA0697997.1 MobC family plasmid mobilization relaxosome protein [Pseudomonadota bacterium]MDA1256208.1 MobC family plasmid mobilization relaxosome protein [Pseudomonadota bacterium]MDA4972944.1 MobC family plasmid mobilization relaxosome protein [Acinetobacter baumannii]OTL50885.1 plasmid mobilization relaxosome protein MobC [Acinetobacter baumannii]PMC94873.1 plasmid mobilization relaxosome protein MobC [Acin